MVAPEIDQSALRHVLVVGGSMRDWSAMGEQGWSERVAALGDYCGSIGVAWLTIRVYEGDAGLAASVSAVGVHDLPACTVIVDASPDGRRRFAEAIAGVEREVEITEKTVATHLYVPADCEPDLVVVLGPPTQLPPSLMWELAYAELVFTSVTWDEFGVDDLAAAVADFAGRSRRFGGLGDE